MQADPEGEQYFAIAPEEDLTPAVIYRKALSGEQGDWLVTTLLERQMFAA